MKKDGAKAKVDRLVGLAQMVQSIKGDKKKDIEKKLKRLTKKKLIEVPLEANERELVERKLNYVKATKELTKWEPIVKERSRSRQLKYPLNEEPTSLVSSHEVLGDMKATTDLEAATQKILKSSDDALTDRTEFTKAEEKFLKAISLEEAKARHTELQKMRALVSHYGAKMKRQKAIKSKSYHKRLKYERRRLDSKKVDSGENIVSEIEKLEKLRAQERATLKHKSSKWAKHAKIQAKYDKNARQAIMDQQSLSEKFSARPRRQRGSDDSSSDDDDDDSEDQIDPDDDDHAGDVDGDAIEDGEDADNIDPFLDKTTDEDRKKRCLDSSSNQFNTMGIDSDGDDDDNDESQMEQRRLMSEAFADDDVVREFDETKKQLADEEQPKDLDQYLPGWNDWAGPGIEVNEKKRERFKVKAKKVNRRDETLGNVIISEKADGNIKQYMVRKLPYPLKSEAALEQRIADPVSSSFRDQVSFREVTQPRVVTRMGTKIEPMNRSELKARSNKLLMKVK